MRAHAILSLIIIACAPAPPRAGIAAAQVRPGIEVLLGDSLHLVQSRRVALLTNQTGVDRTGRRDVDRLQAAGIRVVALYSPEHGFFGTEDRPALPDAVDTATGLPIYSLYRGTRPLPGAAFDSVDAVLVDLQDIGARYYTYATTAVLVMRTAARRGIPVVVLDRPNPVGGVLVQGNTRMTPAPPEQMVGVLPVPMRHGMTLGELLLLANDSYALHTDVTVVRAAGWRRELVYDATGLPWVSPSPNMPDLESALHYSGTCLFEGTNVSVGRGTVRAFQVIGAPWLDGTRVIAVLDTVAGGVAVRGVTLTPVAFTPREPSDHKYDGVPLQGVRLQVSDRNTYDPPRTAVALLAVVLALYPDSLRFHAATFDRLAAGPALRTALLAGGAGEALWGEWDQALVRFRGLRAKYLLY